MDNLERVDPGQVVTIGGAERKLRYTNWAFMQLEKLWQKSLLDTGIQTDAFGDLTTLLWAGLISDAPELDGFITAGGAPDGKAAAGLRQVALWLTPRQTLNLLKQIKVALNEAQKDEPGAEEKKAGNESGETG